LGQGFEGRIFCGEAGAQLGHQFLETSRDLMLHSSTFDVGIGTIQFGDGFSQFDDFHQEHRFEPRLGIFIVGVEAPEREQVGASLNGVPKNPDGIIEQSSVL
jgi:hypothetical protein